MNKHQQSSAFRVISIESARPFRAAQSSSLHTLIYGSRAINLADLAQFIRANSNLFRIVQEAACREFGRTSLRVEDAIVLLGGRRISCLLSSPILHDRAASQPRRVFHKNNIAPSANLCLLEPFQGELE